MMDVKDSAHTQGVALIVPEGCSGASVPQGSDLSPDFLAAQVGIGRDEGRNIVHAFARHRIIKRGHKSIAICDAHALAERSCACFPLTRDADIAMQMR